MIYSIKDVNRTIDETRDSIMDSLKGVGVECSCTEDLYEDTYKEVSIEIKCTNGDFGYFDIDVSDFVDEENVTFNVKVELYDEYGDEIINIERSIEPPFDEDNSIGNVSNELLEELKYKL